MYVAALVKSDDKKHKYEARIFTVDKDQLVPLKSVKFGAVGYNDYTTKTTDEQKKNYIARHSANEDWTKSGYFTPGFWSRWILWNKKTIRGSIRDVNERFGDLRVILA